MKTDIEVAIIHCLRYKSVPDAWSYNVLR